MSFNPGKDRNMMAALKRCMDKAWFGIDVSARAQPPAILNGEFVTGVNAANTGTVNLIGVDTNDKVVLGDAALQTYATVNLTAANLTAMNGAPVQVLPAPGAGKMIVVDAAVLQFKPGATQFTGGGAVVLQYGGAGTIAATSTVAAAQITSANPSNNVMVGVAASGVPTNVPLNISNATAAFATGNGSVVLTVFYHVVTLG